MSDKEARLRLRISPEGLNDLPAKIRPPAKKIEETLSGAIVQWIKKSGKEVAGFVGRTANSLRSLKNIRFSKDGFIATLHAMDVKALVVARKIKGYFKDAFGGAKKQLGTGTIAAGMLAAEYGKRGIDLAVGTGTEMVGEANRVQEAANRISIGARGAGEDYADPSALTKEFFDVAKDVKGITAEAAADAAAKFVSLTGDLKTVRGGIRDFAVAATAAGAEIGDVSEAVASLSTQFGVTDPRQIREVLAALIYQGKAGSFELKDAAALFQRLAASGASFGIDRTAQGVKTLGGLTQIARSGTGSGEQAATAVENLLTNLKVKSGDLRAQGVRVYKGGKVRDVPSILVDAISKVGGTSTERKNEKLAQIFGEQGIRAINPLIAKYQQTFQQTEGTAAAKRKAAVEMLKAEFDKAINAAGTWSDVMSDSARAQNSNSAKMSAAWQTLTSQVSESVLPSLTRIVDDLSKNPDAINAFADAVKLAGGALETFADFAGMISSGKTPEEYAKSKVARELREKEEKAQKELRGLQMSPEQIADLEQKDPKKLGALRAQATLAKIQAESAGSVAAKLEQEVLDSQAQHANGALAKIAEFFTSERAQTARKIEFPSEQRVRVMNPQDIRPTAGNSPSGGAPTAPGYTRGG